MDTTHSPRFAIAAALLLAGCATAPTTAPTPGASASAGGGTGGTGASVDASWMPDCTAVGTAIAPLLTGLAFSERLSAVELPAEAYAQRLCVFSTPDESAQIGVTIAAVPLLDSEVELYAQSPTAVADPRLAAGQVLQVSTIADADDGHLDGALSLFDAGMSVTLQGYALGGSTAGPLPQLTVAAATDAAFAVRAILP